jgi:hypothetical protein
VIRNRILTTLLSALLLLLLASAVRAGSPPPALRSAITAGGGTLAANGSALTDAIGQPLAGPVATQGQYALTSGLVGGASGRNVYLPGIRR